MAGHDLLQRQPRRLWAVRAFGRLLLRLGAVITIAFAFVLAFRPATIPTVQEPRRFLIESPMIDVPIRDAFGLSLDDPILLQFVDYFVSTVTAWPVLSAVVFAGLTTVIVTIARSTDAPFI